MSLSNSHINLYESRYQEGYMESWDESKKNKIIEIVKTLNLSEEGSLLDFGSGNGVFTILLKSILPKWKVYGFEISQTALSNAKKSITNCTFFGEEELDNFKGKFDFVFSHHVLEHVQNLEESITLIISLLKEKANQLHILPCGNEGSFEHQICILKLNGIETDKGNRFFFEESGHLRRVTTEEFSELENKFNFKLENQFYSNQYWGAINWITKSSPSFTLKFTSTHNAINKNAAGKLKSIRRKLLPLTILQFPYSKYSEIKSKWNKNLKDYIKLILLFIPGIFSKSIFQFIEKKSIQEWHKKIHDKKGSEMFLYFVR